MTRALHLTFDQRSDPVSRSRISYAFRVFCAVYGYIPSEGDEPASACALRLHYGSSAGSEGVALTASYIPRRPESPAPSPVLRPLPRRAVYDRLGIRMFPGFSTAAPGSTDWLGEIFEWISGADEYAVAERDSIGRVPYRNTVHGRFGLDPSIPYAAIAMHELNAAIRERFDDVPELPQTPWSGAPRALIAATHDLDFIPLSPLDSASRLLKNVAKAAVGSRDPRLAAAIGLSSLRGIVNGRSPLNYLALMRDRERALHIDSTYNVICRRAHRRDANYTLDDKRVRSALDQLARSGAEIAVHGSYTSLESRSGLQTEFAQLEAAGFPASGIRQHWLRHSGSRLFDQLERVGVRYDTTVGYSERAGFRSGACFPYPPYCFAEERAYRFLELPLAIMDGSLYEQDRSARTHRSTCDRILNATRGLGWGGVSILWHNTAYEGGQLPLSIGELYWDLKDERDEWTTAANVVDRIWARFAEAGLVHA